MVDMPVIVALSARLINELTMISPVHIFIGHQLTSKKNLALGRFLGWKGAELDREVNRNGAEIGFGLKAVGIKGFRWSQG